jgi:ERCC4-type nuclease
VADLSKASFAMPRFGLLSDSFGSCVCEKVIGGSMSTKPAAPAFKLPALRSLGELAGSEPVIIIDTREQDPLPFSRLKTQVGTLIAGDYSIVGLERLFAVERKSIPDLVGCCIGQNRERLERELHRLRGFSFKRLLVVGSEAQILKGQ